jgi:hypothetical protein
MPETLLGACRCQISGGSGPEPQNPVQCQEVWAFDDDRTEMKLVGLQAVCPEVFLVKRLLRQLDDKTRQTAMWTLQGMNEYVCRALFKAIFQKACRFPLPTKMETVHFEDASIDC